MSLVSIKRRAEATKWEGETFDGSDLRSMKGYGATFTKCTFKNAKLDLADLRGCRFDACHFENSSITKTDFSTSFFARVSFAFCDLEQSSFLGAYMDDLVFQDCRMVYGETLFLNTTVRGALRFERCNLHGSNLCFREAEPGTVKFEKTNLWSAVTPFGCSFWNSDFDEVTCKRFLALLARVYPDTEARIRLAEMAGDEYRVVERAMREAKG